MKDYMKYIIALIIILAIILAITAFIKYKHNSGNYNFKIYFFDAGKADAILISKDDKYLMIDTGEEKMGDKILKYFKDNNIKKLDYLIITHFDKDHVGSASTIIDNVEIGEVLQTNIGKDSVYYAKYLQSLDSKNIDPQIVERDKKIEFADLDVTVNGPTKIYDKNESNNSSLIVSIKYDKTSFLLTGDAENGRLKDWLEQHNDTYDFVKIPYHGKYQKRIEDLIKSTNPQKVVITCSDDEGAEEDTLKVLKDHQVNYYLTKDGSITVTSNGNKIKVLQ